jgi:hypothetical protein
MRERIATVALLACGLMAGSLPSAASETPQASPTPEISAAPSGAPEAEQSISLAVPFTLEVHGMARLDDTLDIRFDAVDEDSRCPADVVCVWEGNAQVSLSVSTGPPRSVTMALNTNPTFATEERYADYMVRLVRLDPYPHTDVEAPEPYRATFVVLTDEMTQGSQPDT